MKERVCRIHGYYLDPKTCLKVTNHDLRKRVLHKLFVLTLDKPTTKEELAKALGVDYSKLLYQLNAHLKGFWKVKYEEKRRGAREEFIAPPETDILFIMLGADSTVYILDPLANLFGKIREVGTRCDRCSNTQIDRCWEQIRGSKCFDFGQEEVIRQRKLLEINFRSAPFTPMDWIIACTTLRCLEGKGCVVEIAEDICGFIKKMRGA